MNEDAIVSLETLVHGRRSVRGFRPDPVPDALIRRAFALAQQAPSNCNTQPWIVHVVSGDVAERMRAALDADAAAGRRPEPDFPFTGAYRDLYRDRQIDSAKALFAALGITRDDQAGRQASMRRNYRFFDAPHAAFLFLPEPFGPREAADCGMFAQTLMLALTALGVDSCAQGALGHYAATVRDVLGVPDGHRLLFGIAFGWQDADHPANAARVGRASLDEAIVFHA
ncbi:nitroreductase [Sphingomonas solaris]|uniref:Nitroreductase n=1 Tax=Alterirhizorhabdus solaris TaxID=2529389 RepID=A0A558R3F0_9SPHN|nr:nitroreductase [Sphingomonas solaris]TVV73906.1 nitroreductase [Sphingomonas solaris]